jgi:hypothetical protein
VRLVECPCGRTTVGRQVAYLHEDRPMVAFHYAMPFGATGSVFTWDRVGDLILYIARILLFMALSRYVDDYFGPERYLALRVLAGHVWQCMFVQAGDDGTRQMDFRPPGAHATGPVGDCRAKVAGREVVGDSRDTGVLSADLSQTRHVGICALVDR